MTDTFTWRTRKTAQGTETARTLQAQFGDGYKQIAGMGINDKQETWSLDWTGTRQEAAALRAFRDAMRFMTSPPMILRRPRVFGAGAHNGIVTQSGWFVQSRIR